MNSNDMGTGAVVAETIAAGGDCMCKSKCHTLDLNLEIFSDFWGENKLV